MLRAARTTTWPQALGSRAPWRALIAIGLVALAYHYSLLSLARTLSYQTPLAYLSLVPVIAVGLVWLQVAQRAKERQLHDRQLDYIVGLLLIACAAFIVFVVPASFGARFWQYRLDLLSLPLFTAGVVALLFGFRRLWSLRFPIAFLLLAWPAPYLPVLGDAMRASTAVTVAALTQMAPFLPLGVPVPGSDGVFLITHNLEPFVVSVSSACSGVNSLVGYLLVGLALAFVSHGRLRSKLLWLGAGLVVVWFMNLMRIEAIFAAGTLWGEDAAIDVLHPVAGLVLFNVGVLSMVALMPRFGLQFVPGRQRPGDAKSKHSVAVRRATPAVMVSLVAAVALGTANSGYAAYSAIAGDDGQARILPFDIARTYLPGWDSAPAGEFQQGRAYFGEDSTWERAIYQPADGAQLTSSVPVWIDVIKTDDPDSLVAYGLEACYEFHGYRIESRATVDIGSGTRAQIVDYYNHKREQYWSAIWWEWPFRDGTAINYQRIIVYLAGGPAATYSGPLADDVRSESERFARTDGFLAAAAAEIAAVHLSLTADEVALDTPGANQ